MNHTNVPIVTVKEGWKFELSEINGKLLLVSAELEYSSLYACSSRVDDDKVN